MINLLKLDYVPSVISLVHQKDSPKARLIVTEQGTNIIRLYDPRGESIPIEKIELKQHTSPIILMRYNEPNNIVVSVDSKGIIEYWDTKEYKFPFSKLKFKFKSETDLFEFFKNGTIPTSLEFSKDGEKFVCMGKDRFIRIFRFKTGKMLVKYDETLKRAQEVQQSGNQMYVLENIDFGRRMAIEKTLDTLAPPPPPSNVLFDESGYFIIYPTMLGVKSKYNFILY